MTLSPRVKSSEEGRKEGRKEGWKDGRMERWKEAEKEAAVGLYPHCIQSLRYVYYFR
jgi:hypothetical protein